MSTKRVKNFGCARAFIVFWLGLIGIAFLAEIPILGIIFLVAMLYVIFMDLIHERLFKKSDAEEDIDVSYDPSAHGALVKCPFCGRKIPSDIKFCFYCGNSLEAYKKLEDIRRSSLKKIDTAASLINDGASKDKILKIGTLTNKILKKYEEKPETVKDSSKFTDYYLPKTISAIDHYTTLSSLDDLNADQKQIKRQIEDSLDMITEAFSNILNRISTEGMYDISADVTVLETLLKQDGLTDSDFE